MRRLARPGGGTVRLVAGALTAAGLLLGPLAFASNAVETDLPLTASDATGDVRVYAAKGLTDIQRRSIDLREVTVTQRADRVRFKVRVKVILANPGFDQMVFIDLTPAATSASTWTATIGMSPQMPTLAYAYLYLDATGTNYRTCDPLSVTVLRSKQSMSVDVPIRCIPQEPARIKITSSTGYFRSDAGQWSSDAMRVPGIHLLR